MRKIDFDTRKHFYCGIPFKFRGTEVVVDGSEVQLFLDGHLIAVRDDDTLWVSLKEYPTKVAMDRLRVLGVAVKRAGGKLWLNEVSWDGSPAAIDPRTGGQKHE